MAAGIRVGQGAFWWRVCPATKALWASFWQGFPPADVCQSTTDFFKVSGLPRHGLWPCQMSRSRPGGTAGAVKARLGCNRLDQEHAVVSP